MYKNHDDSASYSNTIVKVTTPQPTTMDITMKGMVIITLLLLSHCRLQMLSHCDH